MKIRAKTTLKGIIKTNFDSQKEFAKKARMNNCNLSLILNQKQFPSFKTARKITIAVNRQVPSGVWDLFEVISDEESRLALYRKKSCSCKDVA